MKSKLINIAIVGTGKIACDQHAPVLARSDAFELIAAAGPGVGLDSVRHYSDIETLLKNEPSLDAVSICTPPQVRYEVARQALEHGCHVFLEKPPAVTLEQAAALVDLARTQNLALFAGWHSREAAGVEPARQWLVQRSIHRVGVEWKEDVRAWHPGQAWIWRSGGLGVFDPGINALSILTRLLPGTLQLQDAVLSVPLNSATPIAASLRLMSQFDIAVSVELDFLAVSQQRWDIDVQTDDGHLQLSLGGAVLHIDGREMVRSSDLHFEYTRLYACFAGLIAARAVDVDTEPLKLVNRALSVGRRVAVAPFDE